MGIGMVALAFTAVYRGASSGSRDQVPAPASTGLEQGSAAPPSASADYSQPAALGDTAHALSGPGAAPSRSLSNLVRTCQNLSCSRAFTWAPGDLL